MKTPREIADSTKDEQEKWLLDPARTPREILLFNRFTSQYTDIHALSRETLTVRLSEIAEQSGRRVIYLTMALLVLTTLLLIFTVYLYKDTHALVDHEHADKPHAAEHP